MTIVGSGRCILHAYGFPLLAVAMGAGLAGSVYWPPSPAAQHVTWGWVDLIPNASGLVLGHMLETRSYSVRT